LIQAKSAALPAVDAARGSKPPTTAGPRLADLGQLTPTWAERYYTLRGFENEYSDILRSTTGPAIDALAKCRLVPFDFSLVVKWSNHDNICEPKQTAYYNELYQAALSSNRHHDIPFILLEAIWRRLPKPLHDMDWDQFRRELRLDSKAERSPDDIERIGNPNLGLPITTERYSVSGHSYNSLALALCTSNADTPRSLPSPGMTTPEPLDDTPHPSFAVSRHLLKIVDRIFSCGDEEGRQGKVSWKDIISVSHSIDSEVTADSFGRTAYEENGIPVIDYDLRASSKLIVLQCRRSWRIHGQICPKQSRWCPSSCSSTSS
jgi:hypothetical protein